MGSLSLTMVETGLITFGKSGFSNIICRLKSRVIVDKEVELNFCFSTI